MVETVKSISGTGGTIAVGAAGKLTLANPNGETYSSVFTGTDGSQIIKNGTGALSLGAGSSTGFQGEFILNSGTIGIGGNNNFGNAGTAKLTINGGTLANTTTNTRTIPAAVTVTLGGDFAVDDSLNPDAGQININGPSTIKGSDRSINVKTGLALALVGSVGQDVAGRSLTKTGGGILALNGVNTYSGNTTILAGQLNVDGNGTLGSGAGTLNLSGGRLNTTANRDVTTDPIANPINLTANSEITTTSTAAEVELNLSSNSIGGSAGTLTFRNDATSGTGVFQPRFSGGGFTFTRPIVIANGAFGTTALQSFNTAAAGDQVFTGDISGTGSFRRTASVAGTGGTTILTGANTYSGGTTLNDGSIGLGSSSTGTAGPLGTGTLTVGGTNPVALFAHGGPQSVDNAIDLNNASLTIKGSNNLTLSGPITLGGSAHTLNVTNTGDTALTGVVAGSASLAKTGTGTLILTNANTYTGGTTVSEGTLVANNGSNGKATGSGLLKINAVSILTTTTGGTVGSVDVDAGATISSTPGVVLTVDGDAVIDGTVIGNVHVTGNSTVGGMVAPGNSPGAFSVGGDLTLLPSAVTEIELGGTSPGLSDEVIAGGLLTFAGILNVSIMEPFAPLIGDVFDIFDFKTAFGAFSQISLPTLTAGFWDTSRLYTTGELRVTGGGDPVVPLPASAWMGLGLLGSIAIARRIRRSRA